MTLQRKFVSGAIVSDASLGERQIRVVASDPTVDRAKDVMVPEGCDLSNYRHDNIVLADHDPKEIIGNAEVEIKNGRVEALITFGPQGVCAKTDKYCAFAKAGFIKTVSVGFSPIEQEPIKGGGYRYLKWELLEISVVAVPANPSAVVLARSASGAPAELKVGASRNLPTVSDGAAGGFDPLAAAAGILGKAGFDGPSVADVNFARKGFLCYDAAAPKAATSYRFPFAKIVDGRLVATTAGIKAATDQLSQAEIPDDVRRKARAVIDHYEGKMKGNNPVDVAQVKAVKAALLKGLYECSELAYVVSRLGSIHDMATFETEIEGDGSNVPAMLASALQVTAAAFLAMTQEEVAELLAGRGIEVVDDADEYVASAPTPMAKAFRAISKAGRVLSKDNEKTLRAAHSKAMTAHETITKCLADMKSAADDVKGVADQNISDDENSDDENSDDSKSAVAAPPDVVVAERKRLIEITTRAAR